MFALNGQGDEQQVSGLPSVWLWLATDRRDVLIQVWDGNNEVPAWRDLGLEAESGRGLLLSVAPAAVTYVVVLAVGSYVSSFIVKPNELDRETPGLVRGLQQPAAGHRWLALRAHQRRAVGTELVGCRPHQR